MEAPTKFVVMDVETSEEAQDDKIVPITVGSTVTSDGDERAWFSDDADPAVVGMTSKGPDETWADYSPGGRPLAQIMSPYTALAMLKYIEEKQKQGYAVCSWNGANFDFRMLGFLAGDVPRAGRVVMGMYDTMYQILTQKGFPLGLKTVGEALGVQQKKTMEGKEAPDAWKRGEFQKVIGYVVGDSQINLKIIQELIKADGFIRWKTKSGKLSSMSMRKLKTVAECLLDPDVNNSWMTDPIDRRKIVAWIQAESREKATAAAEKSEASSRGDPGKGKRPVWLVISGPSGSGKTHLIDELRRSLPTFKKAITTTTRVPRKGEANGVDYNFIDGQTFDKMAAAGEFLEWAEVHGNKYGSSKKDVSTRLAKGDDMVMIVDVQGAESIRKFITGLPAETRSKFRHADVFIMPPSQEELRKRLEGRGKDDASTIETRLANAKEEMMWAPSYKYVVLNDDVNKAWDRLRSVAIAERCLGT